MAQCSNCGDETKQGARFCMRCGRPVPGPEAGGPPPAFRTATPAAGAAVAPAKAAPIQQPVGSSRRILYLSLLVAMVVVGVAIALFWSKLKQAAPGGSEATAAIDSRAEKKGAAVPPAPVLRRLTTDPSRESSPVWMSDAKILFQSNRNSSRPGGNDIWEMNPDGSSQREIVHVNVSTPPEWGDPGLASGIHVLGFSGNIAVYEAQHFHEIMKVALSRASSFPIIRTATDGNDEYFAQLLQVPGGQSASNIVVPDVNSMAAWVANVPGQGSEIRTGDLARMNGQPSSVDGVRLAGVTPSGSVSGMCFSSEGSELVAGICWQDCAAGRRGPDLFVLDARSGQVTRQLTNSGASGASNSSPHWTPFGNRIVFESTNNGQRGLWITAADGHSAPTRIDTGNMQSFDPSWSRDGTKVLFVGVTDGNQDIWLADGIVLPK
jgi:hypothetical protein